MQLYNKAAVELWGQDPGNRRRHVARFLENIQRYRDNGTSLPPDVCPMANTPNEGKKKAEREDIIIEKPNGERRHIMPYPQPIFYDSCMIGGAINISPDITAKKESETLPGLPLSFSHLMMPSYFLFYTCAN
ncbi:MAG: hypothetical protein ACXWWA_06980 [Chitinophagaceae bacterium]